MALATPLIHQFATEIAKLPTEERTRRIAKVLGAMRGHAYFVPTITLPLPPSVNRLCRAGRHRRYRSPQYDAWRTGAGWELKLQRPAHIAGPVTVAIAAARPISASATSTTSPLRRSWICSPRTA